MITMKSYVYGNTKQAMLKYFKLQPENIRRNYITINFKSRYLYKLFLRKSKIAFKNNVEKYEKGISNSTFIALGETKKQTIMYMH